MVYINCVVFVTYKHLCFLPANLLYYYFIVISRENTLMILASKCRKCKHAKSGAITLMCIKTNQKAAKVSNEHLIIYLCFSRIQVLVYYCTLLNKYIQILNNK